VNHLDVVLLLAIMCALQDACSAVALGELEQQVELLSDQMINTAVARLNGTATPAPAAAPSAKVWAGVAAVAAAVAMLL
jgi:hypothetical protein